MRQSRVRGALTVTSRLHSESISFASVCPSFRGKRFARLHTKLTLSVTDESFFVPLSEHNTELWN